jgi:hypothetical protein
MFAPSINIDFTKLQQEETEAPPRAAKTRAAPKARAAARKPAATDAAKSGKE